MMILITYDVNTSTPQGKKRLAKVAKTCLNYGTRVQNSVFECMLDGSQALLLKDKLSSIIDYETDSLRFYYMGKNWDRHVEVIGCAKGINFSTTLIV